MLASKKTYFPYRGFLMRNIISAFTIFLAVSFSMPLLAAGLPPLDSDFPQDWKLRLGKTCKPKEDVELKVSVYTQQANQGMTKIIMLNEKNGVRYSQSKVLLAGNTPVGISVDILVNGKLVSLSSKRPEELDKLDSLLLEATGLTKAEYKSCLE